MVGSGARRLGAALVVLAALAVAPAPAHAAYEVGTAVRDIDPTAAEIATGKVYLGGYGIGGNDQLGVGRKATGVLGEGASVRAFAVADGRGGAFAVADMEVQGWFAATKDGPYGIVDMRRAVERATGGDLRAGEVVVQSDHSHSGVDTMGVWGGVPVAYRKRIFDRTVEAVVAAWTQRREGTLRYGTADGLDLLSNQFSDDPANAGLDREVRVLQARGTDGKPFATLLNFSAHTTVLGSDNTQASGDWVQRANPLLEAAVGGTAVTTVATLGRSQPARADCADATAQGEAKQLCMLDAYAGRVVDRAKVALAGATAITGDPAVAARSYFIQDPSTNPVLLGLGATDPLGASTNRAVLPPWLTATALGTITASARIGDVLVSSGPGELYPQIPEALRAAVGPDARGFMTLGLANDQLGYIIAPFPEAYRDPICRSVLDRCDFDEVPTPSPIGNDNYFFNASHTLGERVICSLMRGAGEVLATGSRYRDARAKCVAFANDLRFRSGADVGGSPDAPGGTPGSAPGGQGVPAGCRDRLAPRSRITRPGSRLTRRGVRLRGRSTDPGCAGHARIAVSIARRLGRRGQCRFLRADGTFGAGRSCLRTTYLPARGTARWSFALRARVPRGRYLVWVRGTDRAGNRERKDRRRNLTRFTR